MPIGALSAAENMRKTNLLAPKMAVAAPKILPQMTTDNATN